MGEIFDAISDFVDSLEKAVDKGSEAARALLILVFTSAIIGAVVTAAFSIVRSTYEGNSGLQSAIGGAEAAYNVGGTFQDVFDVAKIVWPVIMVIGGLVGSGIVLITKLGDRLQDLSDRLQDLSNWLEDLFNR